MPKKYPESICDNLLATSAERQLWTCPHVPNRTPHPDWDLACSSWIRILSEWIDITESAEHFSCPFQAFQGYPTLLPVRRQWGTDEPCTP